MARSSQSGSSCFVKFQDQPISTFVCMHFFNGAIFMKLRFEVEVHPSRLLRWVSTHPFATLLAVPLAAGMGYLTGVLELIP
ncbi:hypothetical protein ACIP2Z_12180 [Streptomyces iakyrus]|uniref:Uncharacterized protein n=1 Tax=Streptomyces iakyrus TaxID=68219 RepID=A0ABW8FCE5_9ACTN